MNGDEFTQASLFSGLGGFTLGFKAAGFRATWANELDRSACTSYRKNNPESELFPGNICDFSPARLGLEAPDVLTAGFPCQPFSSAGHRLGLEDERGRLYVEISRILKEYGDSRPPLVLLENVSNLLGHDRGKTFTLVENEFRDAGYWILPQNVARLNTRIHTDIPQNRERVFIAALSTNVFRGGNFDFPAPVSRTRPIKAFLDLQSKADDYYYFDVENNRFGNMINECLSNGNPNSIYQLRRSYVREHQTFVPTLTANMGVGGHNVPVVKDSWGLRKLTPTECARLQGLTGEHLEFDPNVTRAQQYKQIGNMVTIPLVTKLAHGCRLLLAQAPKRRVAA